MDKLKYRLNWLGIKLKYNVKFTLAMFRQFLTKWLSMFAFWIIGFTEKWNKPYYDKNIIYLYQSVREKKAFTFKMKMMNMGKGNTNVKVLMIETEKGTIKIDITKEKYPHLFK